MLAEFEEILEAAKGSAKEQLGQDLRTTARTLIERQFIFAADHQGQKRFELARRHRAYFTGLFDALGFDFFVDDRSQMVGIVNQAGTPSRKLGINETLFLLGLRIQYEQRLREFEIKEAGVCEVLLSDVWKLISERTHRPTPSNSKCRSIVESLRRHGIVVERQAVGDGDIVLEIRPVILRIVNSATIESLERYATSGLDQDEGSGSQDEHSLETGEDA